MKPNPCHPKRDKYHEEIDNAIQDLIHLEKNGFFSVPRVSWWNLKYKNLAEYCFHYRHTDSCIEGMGCGCAWNSPESTFHGLFSSLDEILDLFMNEKYLSQELNSFQTVKDHEISLNQWLLKNSKLGTEDFMEFWIDWYEEEENVIKLFIVNWHELEIKFQGEEWQSTIDFLKIIPI